MDFPVFHLDILGNRALVAIIAILHVLVNHGLAVGLMPLIALMEWHGVRKNDPRWDNLAYRILFVAFIITTTVGALTGVGIWFSVSLVNPYSIGSLIRVFFWAWFVEWLVFITEVCLILAYTLTWKKWASGEAKRRHVRLGFALATFSWITMAIIVSILGFMMDPGNWLSENTLLAGFTNPIYLPQLAFRTPLAAAMAGIVALFLVPFFVDRHDPFRLEASRAIALWTLIASPFVLLGGWWYYSVIPGTMMENLAVSAMTLQFMGWLNDFLWIVALTVLAVLITVQLTIVSRRGVPRFAYLLPLLAVFWLTGHFERVREFIRKPYVIGRYMYANGLRVEDYPLLRRDGLLAYTTYSIPLSPPEITAMPDRPTGTGYQGAIERLQRGKDVFMTACSRCHTTNGVNAVATHMQRMFGDRPWSPSLTLDYLSNMHNAQPYMPPFPGTQEELFDLATYLELLQRSATAVAGAQQAGSVLATPPGRSTALRPLEGRQ
ncbi:MAG: cytochrome c [Proteobacteria bacterium]|nr:cytochrome c [Pseudomonadota bacterium]